MRRSDRPVCTYLICSAPRTGSTPLASALESTKLAGRPAEYFDIHKRNEDDWRASLKISDEADYLDRVIDHATGANGVCGLKLHWHQTERLRSRLLERQPPQQSSETTASLSDLMHEHFGRVRHIWVRRRNKVAQGISYYLAARTDICRVPRSHQPASPQPTQPQFDLQEIHRCVQLCGEFDKQWEAHFRSSGVAPLIVVYENFVQSRIATALAALRFIGVTDVDESRVSVAPLVPERRIDMLSQQWEQRYRAAASSGNKFTSIAAVSPSARGIKAPENNRRSYLICTSPHTGSALLTDALASAGVAGKPLEYFGSPKDADHWKRSFAPTDEAEFFDKVIEKGSSPNGVFGAEIHWSHTEFLCRMIGLSLGSSGAKPPSSLEELIRAKFSAPSYVWLRRRNKVAQAISLYCAGHPGIWQSAAGRVDQRNVVDDELEFDFEKIAQAHDLVCEHDWQWGNFFTENNLTPLMIFYEDLVANFETLYRGVLKFLKVPYDQSVVAGSVQEIEADSRSQEWERRFNEEKIRTATLRLTKTLTTARNATDEPSDKLPFIAYRTTLSANIPIVAAPTRRTWMDATPRRFAYRCLPMVIANQCGWFLLNSHAFTVTWNGTAGLDALTIDYPGGAPQGGATSHFGAGILTFILPYLFRTPAGFNLHVRGPANSPKDGIYPLEGIVEADWIEATFTMNWKLTRIGHPVVFEVGEPIAMLVPLRRGELESLRPITRRLNNEPALNSGYQAWCQSRSAFNRDLKSDTSDARGQEWQRHYMLGKTVTERFFVDHQTSLSLSEFSETDYTDDGRPNIGTGRQ